MKKLFLIFGIAIILSGCGTVGYVEETQQIENDTTHVYAWINHGGLCKPIKIKKDKVVHGQEVKYVLNWITHIQPK